MKKRTSLFVIAAIIVSLLIVIASRFAMVLNLPANDNAALSSSDSLNILSEFPAEISYVERKYDLHIETLDKETLSLLRQEAISNLSDPDYKFADLMDKIALAYVGNRCSKIVAFPGDPAAEITVYRPFGPLYGECFTLIPTGVTGMDIKTGTIFIASGSDLYGAAINAKVSKSVSYTCQGPADRTTLYNGQSATHRMAFGVLYGTIIKHTVQYPGGNTHVFYYVEQATMDAADYAVNIQVGASNTYSDTLMGTTLHFPDQRYLYSAIQDDPTQFLAS